MNPYSDTHLENLQLIKKLISGQRVAMLTLCGKSGQLESKPMTVLEFDSQGAFWFYCEHDSYDAVTRECYKRANLAFSDESHATYLSLSGGGEIVNDRARIHALWTGMAKPWFPDGPDSPRLALLKFSPEQGEYWDGPGSSLVRMLALAVSAAAGKPVGMGEHGVLNSVAATPNANGQVSA
jgi:general stress protein 26